MIIFIDDINKIVYIMAPKCGSTSIAKHLNVNNIFTYEDEKQIHVLKSNDYLKIIIYRKNIYARFMSGFYEDLISTNCYNEMDINFGSYLLFLYNCFINKIPEVNNLYYNGKTYPLGYGGDLLLPITNNQGVFVSHIQSQKKAISYIINIIEGNNVKICELSNLNKLINNIHENKKDFKPININLDITKLNVLKNNNISVDYTYLTETHKELIDKIYKEDYDFIDNLIKQYEMI